MTAPKALAEFLAPSAGRQQCSSRYVTQRGRNVSVVGCTEDAGHKGDHRGFRKRWDDQGQLVKLTKKRSWR